MLRLIAAKLPAGAQPGLAQADCARLPFAAGRFDIVHAVRVFHHLSAWRACIAEARRVLRPGGALVIVENLPPPGADPPPWAIVQGQWDAILRDLGIGAEDADQGIWLTDAAMEQFLIAEGAKVELVDLLRYREKPVSPRIMVERRAARMFSSDWRLPPAVHQQAARALADWLGARMRGA